MGFIRNYLLRIIASAMAISILTGISGKKGSNAVLIRLIGGLFLTLTIIQPLLGFDWRELALFTDNLSTEGKSAAARGELLADEQYRSIIKSEAEAYILDKAQDYNAEIEVEVTLCEENPPVPFSVRVCGLVSPYSKIRLQQLIEDDLGIRKEYQRWIG